MERWCHRVVDALPLPLHRLTRRGRAATSSASLAPALLPALVILLLGAILRLSLLTSGERLHPDEALFAAQARLISHGSDLLLRSTDLDKPPLTIYLTALSFRAFGVSEMAARLPNVFFSLLTVAVAGRLASRLLRNRLAVWLTMLILALSPYMLGFAATVFTDVQATFWILVALNCAAADRWRRAGLAAALALACKSNASLFVPLVAAVGIVQKATPERRGRDIVQRMWALAWPLLLGIATLMTWDLARAPRSYLTLAWARNNPGRLIRPEEVIPRLRAWWDWLGFLTGSPLLTALLLGAVALMLARSLRHTHDRRTLLTWVLAGFVIAFLGWHWLIAFNTYDRYLVPLIPLLALLIGQTAAHLFTRIPHQPALHRGALVLFVLIFIPGTLNVMHGEVPLGGDHGDYAQIDRLADRLCQYPTGTVVYDHWLGWEMAYYLGQDPPVTVRYMALPSDLSDEMRRAAAPRLFMTPAFAEIGPWLDALRQAEVLTEPIYTTPNGRFTLYRLTPPG